MQNFKKSLENYVTFLEEAAAGEKEKYTAVLSYDPKRIDRATSNQQAMNMRLAKMEEQREAEQKRVGLEGLTFHENVWMRRSVPILNNCSAGLNAR